MSLPNFLKFFGFRRALSMMPFIILYDSASKAGQTPSRLLRPIYAIVRHGDTVATVAQRYHLTPEKLIQYNNIKPPYEIYIGQPLKIPEFLIENKVKDAPRENNKTCILKTLSNSSENSAVQGQTPLPPKKPRLKNPLPNAAVSLLPASKENFTPPLIVLPSRKPNSAKENYAGAAPSISEKKREVGSLVTHHTPSKGQKFLWPLKGKILSKFGAESNLKHNRGINISAVSGDVIIACGDGIVAYAGNEIKGFGNMILIKHADGWMSAYAHNRHLLVSRGEHVQRGQKIAEAGATGNVEHPQLHFELRKKTRAVDPQKYLGY